MSEAALPRTAPHGAPRLGAITLTALGIVYGDIGTSPLYALKQAVDSGERCRTKPSSASCR